MAKIYDEQVDFKQGGDSGENTNTSVQPIVGSEPLWEDPLNRSPENLRKRTEVLRQSVNDLKYYADYDRALLLRSTATFSFIEPDPGGDPGRKILVMTGPGDLWVYPALTPGRLSGGRSLGAKMFRDSGGSWVPYAGTLGANELSFVASSTYTGMRGYLDADDFGVDLNGLTLGANRLEISLVANPAVAGGVPTMVATITGNPKTKITVTYGTLTPTTVNDVIAFINGDLTSQGTYGLANIIRASTTSPGLAAPFPFTGGVFQGGYDSEAHKVTIATLAAFFAAVDGGGAFINRLREGESLALGFTPGPVERGPVAAKGGRRQSLWDLPTSRVGGNINNTAPAVGWNLFNTGREPEKIPGSVPIGKMIEGLFVFLDGTIVDAAPISLGESGTTLARLASTGPTPGATLIGYGGSGPWHPDAALSTFPNIPPGTVEASLDIAVLSLANAASGDDGALRVGAAARAGVVSVGNLPQDVPADSINGQIDQLLNAPATTTKGGGINARVSESGHVLKGMAPITKDLSNLSLPSAGGQRFAGLLTSTGQMELLNAPIRAGREEFMDFIVQPVGASFAGVPALFTIETVASGSGPDRMLLTGLGIALRYVFLQAMLPSMYTYSEIQPANKTFTGCIVVLLNGSVPSLGSDGDGFYYFEKCTNNLTFEIQLRKLGGSVPNFSTTNLAAAALRFCNTQLTGSNASSFRERTYHLSEGYAAKLLCMPSTGQPWLETYHANLASVGADAIKGSYYLSERAVWKPTAGGGTLARDTDNILVTGDKALLAGVETGTPVDATLNHHHEGIYSKTVMWTVPKVVTVVGGNDLATMALGDQVINSDVSELPVNAKKTAVILKVLLSLTNSTVTTDLPVSAIFRYRSNGAIADIGDVETAYIFYKTLTILQAQAISFQVTVRVQPSGLYRWILNYIGGSNLSAGLSAINIWEVGAVITNL